MGRYPQACKEGLLVDLRDNGRRQHFPEMLIERLARTLHGTAFARNREAPDTYPHVVQPGPKAAFINEDTASDGDLFANAFRQWKIGMLVGKRTWGGVVGVTDRGPLLDGGIVFVPEFGAADAAGHWIIEGHGVDPDIVVDQDPVAVLKGHDPQLERGVEELMKLLPLAPAGPPGMAGTADQDGGAALTCPNSRHWFPPARRMHAKSPEMSRDLIEEGPDVVVDSRPRAAFHNGRRIFRGGGTAVVERPSTSSPRSPSCISATKSRTSTFWR